MRHARAASPAAPGVRYERARDRPALADGSDARGAGAGAARRAGRDDALAAWAAVRRDRAAPARPYARRHVPTVTRAHAAFRAAAGKLTVWIGGPPGSAVAPAHDRERVTSSPPSITLGRAVELESRPGIPTQSNGDLGMASRIRSPGVSSSDLRARMTQRR